MRVITFSVPSEMYTYSELLSEDWHCRSFLPEVFLLDDVILLSLLFS